MENKKPWQSKTVWVNAVAGLCAALALFFPGVFGPVGTWVQSNVSLIGIIWAGLNLGLRAITKDKVSLSD